MKSETLKLLGLRLAALRKNKGLMQKQLAGLISVSRQTITDIEKGKRDPSFLTVARWVSICRGDYEQIEKEAGTQAVERRLEYPGRRDEDRERAEIIEKFGRKVLLEMAGNENSLNRKNQ
jgi:DNA-binding XRE family transcriptional regulator